MWMNPLLTQCNFLQKFMLRKAKNRRKIFWHFKNITTKWLKGNPVPKVIIHQVSILFNQAYGKTATFETAFSAFRATRISPFNANIFSVHLFLPSFTTDVPDVDEGEQRTYQNQYLQMKNNLTIICKICKSCKKYKYPLWNRQRMNK